MWLSHKSMKTPIETQPHLLALLPSLLLQEKNRFVIACHELAATSRHLVELSLLPFHKLLVIPTRFLPRNNLPVAQIANRR